MAKGILLGQSNKDVRSVRFVIGTSTNGWTTKDCDYLCDGVDDQEEINTAIQALSSTGGEIKILDGTYVTTATISMNKDNIKLSGNGNSTILKRMWNSTSTEGVITVTATNGKCHIENLQIDGNRQNYTSNRNYGIYLDTSSNNTITENTCNNNSLNGIYLIASSNNTITENTCNNNASGIYSLNSSNNTITENTCNNNSLNGFFISGGKYNLVANNICYDNSVGIRLGANGDNNIVTGNTCIRGTGQPSDYTSSQYTIRLYGDNNDNNLIINNNIMGKNVFSEGGTGNTIYGNKWSADSNIFNTKKDIITTTDWDNNTFKITDSRITATSIVNIIPQFSDLYDIAQKQQDEWNKLTAIRSFDGYVNLYSSSPFTTQVDYILYF